MNTPFGIPYEYNDHVDIPFKQPQTVYFGNKSLGCAMYFVPFFDISDPYQAGYIPVYEEED